MNILQSQPNPRLLFAVVWYTKTMISSPLRTYFPYFALAFHSYQLGTKHTKPIIKSFSPCCRARHGTFSLFVSYSDNKHEPRSKWHTAAYSTPAYQYRRRLRANTKLKWKVPLKDGELASGWQDTQQIVDGLFGYSIEVWEIPMKALFWCKTTWVVFWLGHLAMMQNW